MFFFFFFSLERREMKPRDSYTRTHFSQGGHERERILLQCSRSAPSVWFLTINRRNHATSWGAWLSCSPRSPRSADPPQPHGSGTVGQSEWVAIWVHPLRAFGPTRADDKVERRDPQRAPCSPRYRLLSNLENKQKKREPAKHRGQQRSTCSRPPTSSYEPLPITVIRRV